MTRFFTHWIGVCVFRTESQELAIYFDDLRSVYPPPKQLRMNVGFDGDVNMDHF